MFIVNMPKALQLLFVVIYLFSIAIEVGANEIFLPKSSPEAVNLSRLYATPIPSNARQLVFEQIDNRAGAIHVMLSAYPRRNEDPGMFSDGSGIEKMLIAANSKVVSRSGNTLVIQREQGEAFRFINSSTAGRPDFESDGNSFVYDGVLGNSGYLKVDAFYGSDAPSSFLINPKNGASLYIEGSDLVSVSKDSKRLMIMNNGVNPPFGILMVSLNEAGYEVVVQCKDIRYKRTGSKIIPFFTGWHINPYVGFDVVLLIQQMDSGAIPRYEALPVQFSLKNSTWQVAVPDPQRFTQSSVLACW